MAFRIRLHLPLNITATFSQLLALRHPQLALGFPRLWRLVALYASAFPNCPAHWIGLASSRLSGSRISGADRARRAWLAGCWAKAVVDGWKDQRRCATLSLQRRRAGSILRRLASSTHRLKIRSNHGSGEVHCRHLHALCAGDACFGKGRGWHCSRSGFGGYQKALRNPFGCSSRVLPSRCLGRWSSGCARRFDWSFYKSGGVHVDLVLVDMAPEYLDHLSLVRDFQVLHICCICSWRIPSCTRTRRSCLQPPGIGSFNQKKETVTGFIITLQRRLQRRRRKEMIPEAPAQEPLAGTRPGAKHVARPILGASKPKALRHKKPTVAQLATSLESILNTLPVLDPARWRSCLRGQRLWRLQAGTLALQPSSSTWRLKFDWIAGWLNHSCGRVAGRDATPKTKPKPQPKGTWKKKQKQITNGTEASETAPFVLWCFLVKAHVPGDRCCLDPGSLQNVVRLSPQMVFKNF